MVGLADNPKLIRDWQFFWGMPTHTITLPKLSMKYLHDLLASTGWSRSTADIINSGTIICSLPDEFADLPENLQTDKAAFKAWSVTPQALELTERQRDVCKFVIEKFAKDGKLPPNRFGADLAKAFNFTDADNA